MLKKVALLIDNGWYEKVLSQELRQPKGTPLNAKTVYENALLAVDKGNEEIFRIFFYDGMPFSGTTKNPISGRIVKHASNPRISIKKNFFREIGEMNYVALRRGVVKARGWKVTGQYISSITNSSKPRTTSPSDADFSSIFEQKGVDMRIGMDFATLSLKRLVERIILFSNDTDMTPAIKLARREGLQVIVVQIGANRLHSELLEDADLCRKIETSKLILHP